MDALFTCRPLLGLQQRPSLTIGRSCEGGVPELWLRMRCAQPYRGVGSRYHPLNRLRVL